VPWKLLVSVASYYRLYLTINENKRIRRRIKVSVASYYRLYLTLTSVSTV
jgi:hypothetical protein